MKQLPPPMRGFPDRVIRMTLYLLCHCSAVEVSELVWEQEWAMTWAQTESDCASPLKTTKTTPCAYQHSWWRGDQEYDFLGAQSLWAALNLQGYLVVSCRRETIGLSSEIGQASTCSAIEPCPRTSADQPLYGRPICCSVCGLICIVRLSCQEGEWLRAWSGVELSVYYSWGRREHIMSDHPCTMKQEAWGHA